MPDLTSHAAAPSGATIPQASHHRVVLDGADLHYVTAGDGGAPVLLVHGFPESWWAFHKLIPLIAEHHRVIAVDLPGFGDSGHAAEDYSSAGAAASLRRLIEALDLGAVHLSCQDVSGMVGFRLAAEAPDLIRSFTGIETGLPGLGLELLADVTHGGAWHIGTIAAPGIPELLLAGRERAFLSEYAFAVMSATPGAIDADDVGEFTRVYSAAGGFRGAAGLYRSLLSEGEEFQRLAAEHPLAMPVLAVGAGTRDFTARTLAHAAAHVTEVQIDGSGHLVALEAPERLADALLEFWREAES